MTQIFKPGKKQILEVLEEIAANNSITHFNAVTYEYDPRDFAQYYAGGTEKIISTLPVDLLRDGARIESTLKFVESSPIRFLGISSLVRLQDSKPAHIFQLDYDSRLGMEDFEQFSEKLSRTAKQLDIPNNFYLISSGRGYHIYGGAMDYPKFENYLALLEKENLGDKGWINISRSRGFGNLRISKNESKPTQPVMIGRIYVDK